MLCNRRVWYNVALDAAFSTFRTVAIVAFDSLDGFQSWHPHRKCFTDHGNDGSSHSSLFPFKLLSSPFPFCILTLLQRQNGTLEFIRGTGYLSPFDSIVYTEWTIVFANALVPLCPQFMTLPAMPIFASAPVQIRQQWFRRFSTTWAWTLQKLCIRQRNVKTLDFCRKQTSRCFLHVRKEAFEQ